MKKKQEHNATVISLSGNETIEQYLHKLQADKSLAGQNLVILLHENLKILPEEISLLENFLQDFKATQNKSAVLSAPQIKHTDLQEQTSFAPTLQEAIDIIEMEEIERDLGF